MQNFRRIHPHTWTESQRRHKCTFSNWVSVSAFGNVSLKSRVFILNFNKYIITCFKNNPGDSKQPQREANSLAVTYIAPYHPCNVNIPRKLSHVISTLSLVSKLLQAIRRLPVRSEFLSSYIHGTHMHTCIVKTI